MKQEKAIKLLKKYYKRYIRNLPFVEGKVNKYILIASIDLCIDEESFEMAALFKKFLDDEYYDKPDSIKSEQVYDYLRQAENINNIEKIGSITEDGFMEKNSNKFYFKTKIKDLENQLLLNDRCISKIKSKIVENPFKNDEKWNPIFEYYRSEALKSYKNDIVRVNKELDNFYKKIK